MNTNLINESAKCGSRVATRVQIQRLDDSELVGRTGIIVRLGEQKIAAIIRLDDGTEIVEILENLAVI